MRTKRDFALALIVLTAVWAGLIYSFVAESGAPMMAVPPGSWSSGDRLDSSGRPSRGWKKLDKVPPDVFLGESKAWSPAIASTKNSTVLLWSPRLADKVVGFLWDEKSGTWTKPGGFATPPVPMGSVKSAPALVHRVGDLFDVVVLGKDQYYHAHHTGGKWSAWEPIGGMGGSPAISASRSGPLKLDVWVVAAGSIWRQRWQDATGWQGWDDMGHPPGVKLTAAAGVVVRPDNIIDIVAPAQPDGQLWHMFYSPTDVPSAWETIPGRTFTQPALTSNAPDNLEVWVKGASDGFIYHEVWAGGQWQPFDKSINQVADAAIFMSGPAVNLNSGMTTVTGFDDQGELLVRSWAPAYPTQASATPASVQIRRPLKSPPAWVIEGSAENTLTIAPTCNAVYLSLGKTGDVQRQDMSCVLNGTNQKTEGAFKACDTQLSMNRQAGSTDNQVTVLKNGTVLLIRQGGGVWNETTRTETGGTCRGVENVYFSSNCGTVWSGPFVLDPCDPNGPFDSGFCNTKAKPSPSPTPDCKDNKVPTGTDRPDILASRHDGSVFMALGVAGKDKYNLVLMRSSEADLSSWKVMDTGLGSSGAPSLAESQTHLYLGRCEFGSSAQNVGLYAYRKDQPFDAKNLVFLGNIEDASCTGKDLNISMMQTTSGTQVVRWMIPALGGGRRYFKAGFSALTPGGLVKLQSADFKPGAATFMPTLVAENYSSRALLYWYQLDANGTWRVRGSVSDGIGRWSPTFALSSVSWPGVGQPEPWGFWPEAGHDYMKGSQLKVGLKTKFLAQWVQPVAGNNEIFYGIVE